MVSFGVSTVKAIIHADYSIIFIEVVPLCMNLQEARKKYAPYFVDIWQYLVIIIIFIIAAIFFL